MSPAIPELSPKEAIAYFRQKIAIPDKDGNAIVDDANDWAFAVAHVARADVLADLRDAVDRAIEQGTTMQAFKSDFADIVKKRGWAAGGSVSPYKVELLLSQNLRSAYQAGRYQQMSSQTGTRPHWQWKHRDSRRPRPAHKALHNKVFSFDDPFWSGGFPPCGWGCRCTVFALSQRDLDREKLTVVPGPVDRVTIADRLTGAKQSVPSIKGVPVIEPGFNYTPGASSQADRADILNRMLDRLPADLRALAKVAIDG